MWYYLFSNTPNYCLFYSVHLHRTWKKPFNSFYSVVDILLNTTLLEDDSYKDRVWNVAVCMQLHICFSICSLLPFSHECTTVFPQYRQYRLWPSLFLPPSLAESNIATTLTISIKSGSLGILFWPRRGTRRDSMTDTDNCVPHFYIWYRGRFIWIIFIYSHYFMQYASDGQ